MARPSKLTPELQTKICDLLTEGVSIENIAAAVGITDTTFYNWQAKGREAQSGMYLEFFEAITHAQKQALILAEQVARGGLEAADEHLQSVDEVTEIRLRTVQRLDENGKVIIEKIPYEYRKLTKRTQKRTIPPDPRFALEYLWRRDPSKWARIQKTEHSIDETQLGKIDQLKGLFQSMRQQEIQNDNSKTD